MSESDTNEAIAARKALGQSFSQIGAALGISKDAAQKRYLRYVLGGAERSATLGSTDEGLGEDAPRQAYPEYPSRASSDVCVGFDVAYFDLESTSLNGSFGRLHCGSVADQHGNVETYRIDQKRFRNKQQPSDDGDLAAAIRDRLEQADIIMGYNSKMFDIKLLNTRLVIAQQSARREDRAKYRPVRMDLKHVDLYWTVRSSLRLHSSRLAAVQSVLDLEDEKTAINPRIWHRALDYDKEALDYIADHCERDVLVLREAFAVLKPFIANIHR